MTTEDKIDALEHFTRSLYAPYQYYEYGIVDYFKTLRKEDADNEFLNDMDDMSSLGDYALYVLRPMFKKGIRDNINKGGR